MTDKKITKYDIAYRDVLCTGVKWRYPENNIFYFTKDGKEYEFEQKYYIDNQSADTDHIRCVIVDQFLPWWKNERIKELESENAALREQLKDYEQIESRKNRISKHRHEDALLVADKIARCSSCEYKRTSVEIDGIGKIEICKYPPYKGKWIEEIEQCPKEKELAEEKKDEQMR